jgi:hypothetical protein
MHPTPLTHADGWEINPIDEPHMFFQHISDSVEDVYIVLKDNTKVTIWTRNGDWMPKGEMLRKITVSSNMHEEEELDVKPLVSLKVLAGLIVLGEIGYEAWNEMQYCFDKDTSATVLKPVSWWIAV